MKIRTQVIVSTAVFGAVLLVASTSVVVTNQRAARAAQLEETARNLERAAYELGYLSNDYLLYREGQQLARWETRYGSFTDDLTPLNVSAPEHLALVNEIRANQQRLKAVFTE